MRQFIRSSQWRKIIVSELGSVMEPLQGVNEAFRSFRFFVWLLCLALSQKPWGQPIAAGHNVHDDSTLMAKTRAVAPALHGGISLTLDRK
jgi:hypothetical protein